MTRIDMLAAFARLEAMLDEKVGGSPDTHNALEMGRLLAQLEQALPGPYGQEKIRSAQRWADKLFSVRRYEQWGRDGGQLVRNFIRADLINARQSIPMTPLTDPE